MQKKRDKVIGTEDKSSVILHRVTWEAFLNKATLSRNLEIVQKQSIIRRNLSRAKSKCNSLKVKVSLMWSMLSDLDFVEEEEDEKEENDDGSMSDSDGDWDY
jgi:hypothetical protein